MLERLVVQGAVNVPIYPFPLLITLPLFQHARLRRPVRHESLKNSLQGITHGPDLSLSVPRLFKFTN